MNNSGLHWITDDVLCDLYVRGKSRGVSLPAGDGTAPTRKRQRQAVLDIKPAFGVAGVVEQGTVWLMAKFAVLSVADEIESGAYSI